MIEPAILRQAWNPTATRQLPTIEDVNQVWQNENLTTQSLAHLCKFFSSHSHYPIKLVEFGAHGTQLACNDCATYRNGYSLALSNSKEAITFWILNNERKKATRFTTRPNHNKEQDAKFARQLRELGTWETVEGTLVGLPRISFENGLTRMIIALCMNRTAHNLRYGKPQGDTFTLGNPKYLREDARRFVTYALLRSRTRGSTWERPTSSAKRKRKRKRKRNSQTAGWRLL